MSDSTPLDAPLITATQRAGPYFAFGENGIINFAPPEALNREGHNAAGLRALHPVLRELAHGLATSLGNANNAPHALLGRRVSAYADLIDQPLEAINFARLYAEGVRMAHAAQASVREMACGELPALNGEVSEALDSLLSLHGAFILSTAEGIEAIAAEERYRRNADEENSFRAAAITFAAALRDRPEIIHPEAAAFIQDAAVQISQGFNPERDAVIAVGAIRNVIMLFIKGLAVSAGSFPEGSVMDTGQDIARGARGLLAKVETLARGVLKKSRGHGSVFDNVHTPMAQLVLDAAEDIAGPGAVEQVKVKNAFDSEDRSAYHVMLLVNRERVAMETGQFRGRLRLKVLDEMAARHDEHQLLTEFLDRNDWEKRLHG